MEKEYKITFDFLVNKHTNKESNILHLTTGQDKKSYGDRNPGVWLTKENKLEVATALNDNANFKVELPNPIPTEKWIKLEVSQHYDESKKSVSFTNDFLYPNFP